MWYVAYIRFVRKPESDATSIRSESCDVLLQAVNAEAAYEKAVAWSRDYESDHLLGLSFFGIEAITTIGEDRPDDGTELAGSFRNEDLNIWERQAVLVPTKQAVLAKVWETNQDTPVNQLLSEDQIDELAQALTRASSPSTGRIEAQDEEQP